MQNEVTDRAPRQEGKCLFACAALTERRSLIHVTGVRRPRTATSKRFDQNEKNRAKIQTNKFLNEIPFLNDLNQKTHDAECHTQHLTAANAD